MPEVKGALLRDHWGSGLANETVAAVLKHVRDASSMGEVIASVAADNLASLRVLAKAGMTESEQRRNDDGSITHVFRWRAA